MEKGMVCAPQPEAVEAGAVALKKGGNAVDAAITCALVQTVVDPMMCGLAGFGSMQLFCRRRTIMATLIFIRRPPPLRHPTCGSTRLNHSPATGSGSS